MITNNRIVDKFLNLKTRPLDLNDLELILFRFQLMIEESPGKYDILEFIEQEDFRKDLFIKHNY